MKEIFKKISKRKLFLGVIIIFIMIMVVVGIQGTYAFYQDSQNIAILSSKVGDFSGDGESVKTGPLTDKDTDINIIFYLQLPDNPDKYKENKYVPATGYKVNDKISNCYPKDKTESTYNTYSIDDDGTVNIEYTESKPTQVVCRIYYDRDKLSDVIIYTYIQDVNGDREYDGNKYKLVNQVETNFTLVNYECKSKTANTSFTYTEENGFEITTEGPDTCYAYFSKS